MFPEQVAELMIAERQMFRGFSLMAVMGFQGAFYE